MSTQLDRSWRNWAGLESAGPTRVRVPATVADVVAEVERARAEGTTVKMVGTGHSFTGIAAPTTRCCARSGWAGSSPSIGTR